MVVGYNISLKHPIQDRPRKPVRIASVCLFVTPSVYYKVTVVFAKSVNIVLVVKFCVHSCFALFSMVSVGCLSDKIFENYNV